MLGRRALALILVASATAAGTTLGAIACSTYGDGGDESNVPSGGGDATADAPSIEIGEFRGPCFANGTCHQGLGCVQSVCLQLDDAGGSLDGAAEASVCLKQPNDSSCEASADCCSNACLHTRVCVAKCDALDKPCGTILNTCCLGGYCPVEGLLICTPCLPKNAIVAKVAGQPLPRSCCTNQFDLNTDKCL